MVTTDLSRPPQLFPGRHTRRALAAGTLLAAFAAAASQAAIVVTDTGAGSGTTCTLAQAIHAANLANNPTNATPAGATTLLPLSQSSAAVLGTGSCAGAQSGANTIQLPQAATISFSTDDWADNYWYGPNVLTPIASTITIEGNGARLTMASGTAPRMRFFFIGADPQSSATPGYNTPGPGKLTLRNLQLSGGRQRGGGSDSGGAGAGMGGAIFNQGTLVLDRVTLSDNQATGGYTGDDSQGSGGGMGADAPGDGGNMGGPVPKGSSDTGSDGNLASGIGGAGGGVANGMGGAGSFNNSGTGGAGGNGGGGGGGSGANSIYYNAGGGGGFGGGSGGLGVRAGANPFPGAGGFGYGGRGTSGNGGGVGGGGGDSGTAAGGGGFGGGGGASTYGGKGGFGGGGGAGIDGTGGFGGGRSFPHPANAGGAGAGMGGAIFNHAGSVTVINSTLSGNVAAGGRSGEGGPASSRGGGGSGLGGAIFNLNGSLSVQFSTLAGNTVTPGAGQFGNGAAAGGAIYSLAYNAATAAGSAQATLSLHNSILANTAGGNDLTVDQPASVADGAGNVATAVATATGANLVMNAVQANNAAALPIFTSTADPLLGALADNGGPTLTMALNPGSPAIDTGNACAGALPDVDQRGFARTAGAAPDLGAYESGSTLFDGIFSNGFDVAAGCP